MPFFSAGVSESLTAATTTITGKIAMAGSAPIVTGVAVAGKSTGHVGTAIAGIYGTLKVNANGTFSYVLDNTNPDTAILAAGEQAHDHFEVTAFENGKTVQILVDIAITGAGNPAITTTKYPSTLYLNTGTVLPAGNRLVFGAGQGVSLNYDTLHPSYATNNGAIAAASSSGLYLYTALATGPGMHFANTGRITARTAGTSMIEVIALSADWATNSGVISATSNSAATAVGLSAGSYFDQSQVVNSGLVEAISKAAATGLEADGGYVVNSGEIYAIGQKGTVYGIHSGQSAGFSLINSGTIMAVAGTKAANSVAVWYFPDNTNPMAPFDIINTGTIVGQTAILIDNGYSVAANITNSGIIQGLVQLGPGDNSITNAAGGRIMGSITFTDPQNSNSNIVTNAGVITGNVTFGGAVGIYIGSGKGRVAGSIIAGAGDALLMGGDLADTLVGGSGTDWFVGGAGADTMTAGSHANVFIYRAMTDSTAAAPDTIDNFVSGRDVIDLTALGLSGVTLKTSGGQTELTASKDGQTLVIQIDGTVTAGDVITSGAVPGASSVQFAPTGGGTLTGGSATNIMIGSNGDNTFNAGTGPQQIMIGGTGNNVFNVANSTDRVIAQANALSNVINTTAGILMPANVHVVHITGDQPIGVSGNGNGDIVYMNDAGDYFAGSNNATIYAGAGSDFIVAGSGTRVVYNSVADSTASAQDWIEGFAPGSDKLDLSALGVTSVAITDHPTSAFTWFGAAAPNPEYVYGYYDVVAQTANGALSLEVSTNATGFGMGDIIL